MWSYSAADLMSVDVLVIIGHNRSFSANEYGCIWDFVLGGGGLLVLGDHTDVGGMRDPLNMLLSPVDIRFRFDSALPIDDRWKWETCVSVYGGWVTDFGFDMRDVQVSVGASLDIGVDDFPLILGRYGFSDYGDVDNADFAFLGNYQYDVGEQLGDIVLAAGSFYGDGRVVVFGDTSSFQNSALPRSYEFIDAVFQWLADEDTVIEGSWLDVIALILLGVFVVFFIWLGSKVSFSVYGVPLVALLIIFGTVYGSSLSSDVSFTEDHLLIDASFSERFSLDPFLEDSLSGVVLNFQRNGLLPLYLRQGFDYSSCAASFILFNAPTFRFSDDVVSQLLAYMEDGGVVCVASGFFEKDAVLPLLSVFDIDIENVPLGPVPYVEEDPSAFEFEPRFVNSWPIRFESREVLSFYNFSWNDVVYHLMVFQPYGAGGLLVVSDSEFLLDENVESIYDYWPGNIIFLKHIIDEVIRDGGVG